MASRIGGGGRNGAGETGQLAAVVKVQLPAKSKFNLLGEEQK